MSRGKLVLIAQETLNICQTGLKEQNIIGKHLRAAIDGTKLYDQKTNNHGLVISENLNKKTNIEIYKMTTLELAKNNIGACILNFASARNPGGGFMKGSSAQEESIARSSGLYMCLTKPAVQQYYIANEKDKTGFYTNNIIFSPGVPVFRDDDGKLIDPYCVSVITAPALNVGVIKKIGKNNDLIYNWMENRAELIFQIAIIEKVEVIILGAWGCGVFGGDPNMVAQIFAGLCEKYYGYFDKILFAIPNDDMARKFAWHLKVEIKN